MNLLKTFSFLYLIGLSLNTLASGSCSTWPRKDFQEIKRGSSLAYYNNAGKLVERYFGSNGYHVSITEDSKLLPNRKSGCIATISDPAGKVDRTIFLPVDKVTLNALKDTDLGPFVDTIGELSGKNEKQKLLRSPTTLGHCVPSVPIPADRPDRSGEEEKEDFNTEGFQGLGKGFDKSCKEFIKDDGSFGDFGNIIAKYIDEAGDDSPLLNDDITDMKTTCPNWKKFSNVEKTHFWAHTFASMAMDESTCNPKARNPRGSDGPAAGLLQMPERKSGQAGYYWRGPNCKKATDMYDPNDNIKCSLDIMSELMRGTKGIYKNKGGIFGKKNTSYWEKLKRKSSPKKSRIIKLMLGYEACGY
jgi:hypothetical protein